MKKTLSIFLAAVMLFSTAFCTSFSAFADTQGDYDYEVSNGEATITSYNGEDTVVNVPRWLGGYSVTAIGATAFIYCDVVDVTIPPTVKTIGTGAFNSCDGLTDVHIAEGLETVMDGAFSGCKSLESIVFPSTLKSLGTNVFANTIALKTLGIAKNNDYFSSSENVLFDAQKTRIIRYAPEKTETEYTIPETVTTIDKGAFFAASNIEKLTITKSLESIGDEAFSNTEIKDIYYYGSEEEYSEIKVGKNNQALSAATVHYNAEPEPEPIKTGWVQDEDGKWYYYNDEGIPVKWMQKIGGKYYYFNGAGVMYSGWLTVSGKRYYFGADGAAYTYRKKIGNYYYYFNGASVLQKGWIKGGVWMYGDLNNGALKTGWFKVGGKWYYFKADGSMVTGWQKIGGKWYYLNSSGAMVTGWLKLSGKWYYLSSSGAMVTGKQKINGKWYTFDSNGVMK